jgi:hypothetical protein
MLARRGSVASPQGIAAQGDSPRTQGRDRLRCRLDGRARAGHVDRRLLRADALGLGFVLCDQPRASVAADECERLAFGERHVDGEAQVVAAPGIARHHEDVDAFGRHGGGEPLAPFRPKAAGETAHSVLIPPDSTIDL